MLPSGLQLVSSVLPATYALRALRRALFEGADVQALGGELATLGLFAAVLLPVSALILGEALRRAARDGTLGQA